jgi:hypothetical protein
MLPKYCTCKIPSIAGMLNQLSQKQCVFCGGVVVELTDTEQTILLKIKSLLNDVSYFIKDEHKSVIDEYHSLCRKFCSWGG